MNLKSCVLIVWFILTISCYAFIARLECLLYGSFDITFSGKYYLGNISKTIFDLSLEACATNCVTDTQCTCFNFISNGGKCILLREQINKTINEENLVEQQGSIFVLTDHNSKLVRMFIKYT